MTTLIKTKTIQMTVEECLLAELDAEAEHSHETRSAFVRAAIQTELKQRRMKRQVEAHRNSHLEQPDDDVWQPAVRAWGDS